MKIAPYSMYQSDEYFMRQALKQAQLAFDDGEVPIGAVVVINHQIISRGYNQTERLSDPTAHAEMIALTAAFNQLGAKYLPEATLYVTVEPCLMCAGAIYWSKLKRIVWGAHDEKNGHQRITGSKSPFHPKASVTQNVLETEAADLMKTFFQLRR